MESTKKKLAIVTGAARGIGLATAKLFNQNDYKVAIVDRDKNELSNLSLTNNLMKSFCYDISDFNNVDMMYQKILEWHDRVDVLVNNAGVADFGSIEMTDFKRWNEVMKTNLDGAFMCSQKAINYLKTTKGSIINIASISGLRASTLRVAYGTSKAAIIQLTKQQAAELGEYGIRVNCVAPGPVKTKLAMAVHTQDIIDAYHDAIPLNIYGTEYEIANAMFLNGEAAMIINGDWSWGDYKDVVEFGIAPLPKVSSTGLWPSPMVSTKGYSININTIGEKLLKTKSVLTYLTSPEVQLYFTKKVNSQPSSKIALLNCSFFGV